MPARSITIILNNDTDRSLTKAGESLAHGIWDSHPPQHVGPHSQVSWKSESQGILTGTEGSVTYQLDDGSGQVTIHWDNPYAGVNSYEESAPAQYTISHSGGSGNNTTVTFTLQTLAISISATPIQTLAIRIVTGADFGAGTDNDVYFDIGPLAWLLDTPNYNDFERNADDIMIPGIRTRS